MAGGDSGGLLGPINLATSTVSSAVAQLYNPNSDSFGALSLTTSPLNTARESAVSVVLPNGLTLIVGGETCKASSYGGASGFLCAALNTAELYNESGTPAFTYAGSGSGFKMTIARSGPSVTLIEGSGTALDGQVLIMGGSTGSSFLATTTPTGNPSQTALNTGELYNPVTDTFTALSLPIPPCPAGESPATTPACTSGLASVCSLPATLSAISTTSAATTGVPTQENVTVNMPVANPPGLTIGAGVIIAGVSCSNCTGATGYNGSYLVSGTPTSSSFTYTVTVPSGTALTAGSGGTAEAGNLVSLSESGTTVTANTTANPSGLIVGDYVAISGVTPVGYNGSALKVTEVNPSGTSFQYTATVGSLSTTTTPGGVASANTYECGMVDQEAALIPNDGGQILIAGGDLITFLGESSNLSFIFNPAAIPPGFTQTGSLTTPRELFSLVALDPKVVTGSLSGDVVAFGGIEANSAVCTVVGDIVATTLNTAEVYNPTAGTWSVPASTMGVKRAGYATLFDNTSDTLAGDVILPGGVDVEAGTFPSTCVGTTLLKQTAEKETDLYDAMTDPSAGGTFSATGSLTQAREGAAQAELGGTNPDTETDIIVIGGACTESTANLDSFVIGTSTAGQAGHCASGSAATTDYSELYSQSLGTWSLGPAALSSGADATNNPASAVLP